MALARWAAGVLARTPARHIGARAGADVDANRASTAWSTQGAGSWPSTARHG